MNSKRKGNSKQRKNETNPSTGGQQLSAYNQLTNIKQQQQSDTKNYQRKPVKKGKKKKQDNFMSPHHEEQTNILGQEDNNEESHSDEDHMEEDQALDLHEDDQAQEMHAEDADESQARIELREPDVQEQNNYKYPDGLNSQRSQRSQRSEKPQSQKSSHRSQQHADANSQRSNGGGLSQKSKTNPFLGEEQKQIDFTPKQLQSRPQSRLDQDVIGSRPGSKLAERFGTESKNLSDMNFLKYSAVIGSDALGQARALIAEEEIGGNQNGLDIHNKSNLSHLNLLNDKEDSENNSGFGLEAVMPVNFSNVREQPQYSQFYQERFQKVHQALDDKEQGRGKKKKKKSAKGDDLNESELNIFKVDLTDPDKVIQNVEEEVKEHQKKRVERDISGIQSKLERMDTNYTELEDIFESQMRSKEMDIEHLDPQEMLQKESIIEFNELKRLEKQMRKVEKQKITLLKDEKESESELLLGSGQRGLTLEELEAHYEFKAQERERALTRLFGRLNSKIKAQILSNEGTSQVQVRKIPPYKRDADKKRRLFEGIRDQRVGAKWLKTPQPVEIKCMMIRGLKDKVPKGNYVVRCGVLNRMIENKMYYKFLEYGSRVKAEEEARIEREELQKKIEEEEKKKTQELEKLKNGDLFHNNSKYSSVKEIQDRSSLIQQEGSVNYNSGYLNQDDEEKRLVIFQHDSDDEDQKAENGGDLENNGGPSAQVKFGFGTNFEPHERHQNPIQQNNSKVNPLRLMNGAQVAKSKNDNGEDEEAKKRADFDKIARYSLYKPQGGSLSKPTTNQSLEKVWIDFGKQHTKLVKFEGQPDSDEMKFQGHKIYFIVPPNMNLQPSNVLIFELIWLSSQTQHDDYIAAWGAFPLVNGDFQINEGKFKIPLLNGAIDFTSNKFKDIEKKYIRNVDEWLANLYIEVKKFDLVDFQMYNQKIEFKVPIEKEKKKKQKQAKTLDQDGKQDNELRLISDQDEQKEKEKSQSDQNQDDSDDSEFDFDEGAQYYGDDDKIEYHRYKYKVNQSNYDLRSTYESQDITMRKLQYVTGELLSDLGLGKLNFFNFIETTLIAFIVIWLRMAFHYLGQYLMLKAMNCPVMSVKLQWYKLYIDYAFWNIGQEVAVITIGVVSNTVILCLMILVCHISQKYIYCFPRSFCRLIAWFAIATVFDFFLIAVIDFAVQDWEGDFFKLYNYYTKSSSSGFVGYFLTFIIQLGLLIVNLFIFYNYIVFVHLDGRLADIWSRISGKVKHFFIPHDNEVSFNYLRNLYQLGEINNNRIIVNKIPAYNLRKPTKPVEYSKLIHFYKFESEISLEQGRVFVANQRGQIQEINLNAVGQQHDDTDLEYFLKNAKEFMRGVHGSPQISSSDSDDNMNEQEDKAYKDKVQKIDRKMTIQRSDREIFNDSVNKLKRRMTLQSSSHNGGARNMTSSFIQGTFDKQAENPLETTPKLANQTIAQNKTGKAGQGDGQGRDSLFGPVKNFYDSIKKINSSTHSRKSNVSQGIYEQVMGSQPDSARAKDRHPFLLQDMNGDQTENYENSMLRGQLRNILNDQNNGEGLKTDAIYGMTSARHQNTNAKILPDESESQPLRMKIQDKSGDIDGDQIQNLNFHSIKSNMKSPAARDSLIAKQTKSEAKQNATSRL